MPAQPPTEFDSNVVDQPAVKAVAQRELARLSLQPVPIKAGMALAQSALPRLAGALASRA